jgi:hypothetical protein
MPKYFKLLILAVKNLAIEIAAGSNNFLLG